MLFGKNSNCPLIVLYIIRICMPYKSPHHNNQRDPYLLAHFSKNKMYFLFFEQPSLLAYEYVAISNCFYIALSLYLYCQYLQSFLPTLLWFNHHQSSRLNALYPNKKLSIVCLYLHNSLCLTIPVAMK